MTPLTLQTLFDAGDYRTVITLAAEQRPREACDWRILGMSHLRLREFEWAQTPLTRAALMGDPEAQIELGNLMRLMGRYEEAVTHFAGLEPMPEGELSLRLQRWWGASEFQLGKVESGLARCEEAWHGYMLLGDDELTARVTQTLAQMYSVLGNMTRALQLNKEALHILKVDPLPYPRLSTLHSLSALYADAGLLTQAEVHMREMRSILTNPKYYADQWMLLLLASEAQIAQLKGDRPSTLRALLEIREMVESSNDHEVRIWTAIRLAEFYSQQGQFAQALEVLHLGSTEKEAMPIRLMVIRGMVLRRRGQFDLALKDFETALPRLRESGDAALITRTLLHYADTLRRASRGEEHVAALREGLDRLMRAKDKARFQPDLEELGELVHSALLEPDVAPFMEAVMEKVAAVTGSVPLDEERLTHVQVETLGRTRVVVGGEQMTMNLLGSALVLVYLARHPGRTRQEIQKDLYPHKAPSVSSNYVRSVFRELREILGKDAVVQTGPHNMPRYSLGPALRLTLDVQEVELALERGDLPRILALYHGPFLHTINDSDWVSDLRGELQSAVTGALRAQMIQAREAGDNPRALLVANQLLRVDPYDPDVLNERIEIARGVASDEELSQYVVEMQRVGY